MMNKKSRMRAQVAPLVLFPLLILASCDSVEPEKVEPANAAPVFVSSPDTVVFAGSTYSYTAEVRDEDGSGITVSVLEKPDWLSVDNPNSDKPVLSGVLTREDIGVYEVELQASDGEDTTRQHYRLYVGHAEAGVYRATSFTYYHFFSGWCHGPYNALVRGGYADLTLELLGAYKLQWQTPANEVQSEGQYTISGDSLLLSGLDRTTTSWNLGTDWRIDPPMIYQPRGGFCGGKVRLEREE